MTPFDVFSANSEPGANVHKYNSGSLANSIVNNLYEEQYTGFREQTLAGFSGKNRFQLHEPQDKSSAVDDWVNIPGSITKNMKSERISTGETLNNTRYVLTAQPGTTFSLGPTQVGPRIAASSTAGSNDFALFDRNSSASQKSEINRLKRDLDIANKKLGVYEDSRTISTSDTMNDLANDLLDTKISPFAPISSVAWSKMPELASSTASSQTSQSLVYPSRQSFDHQDLVSPPSSTWESPQIAPFSNASSAAVDAQFFRKRVDRPPYKPVSAANIDMNYRQTSDRNANYDWPNLVEKIITENDQRTSIFMQQKLKLANGTQKDDIVDAIVESCCPLMRNRFGNFLVQRCLEYGNEHQVERIIQTVIGKVYTLAKDQFGCHVIQKILDCANSKTKSRLIEEMLANVNEGITHQYACHVWQKLLELRWDSSTVKPSIMEKVNHELKNKWTTVALAEAGSLVVQNVFENCVLSEKLPSILEIIENLDTVIQGQWGNWVIQHMVEHAPEPYRGQAINKVIEQVPKYAVDQFASKAVEKMLKMGDAIIIQKFLDKVLEKSGDRPRIPLIDIASDAHGNYLVQYILLSGTAAQKETVAIHVKKYIVSLRGSKWGSKCAWLIDKNRANARKGSSRA